nr:hypothetical protein [Gordonia asplenii]
MSVTLSAAATFDDGEAVADVDIEEVSVTTLLVTDWADVAAEDVAADDVASPVLSLLQPAATTVMAANPTTTPAARLR